MERQDTQLTQTGAEVQALLDKVEDIMAGAEVNVIEAITVNSTPIAPDENRTVDITVPVIEALSTTDIDTIWDE